MTKRRTKGEGGLTQRHDHASCPPAVDGTRPEHRCRGRWQGTLDVMVDGRRRRKTVYGRTMAEARTKLNAAKKERDAGTLVLTTSTVEQWMDRWLQRRETKLKPQTLRGYQSKSKLYIVPHLGRHRLTSLRAEHIENMYDAMRAEGLQESTVRQTHAILKKALTDARRGGKVSINPVDNVEPPGTQKARREQFTPHQARQVLAATDDARWWLALYYGMRQGEVLGLDWSTIDLTAKTLRIEQTLQTDLEGHLFLGTPKTSRSQRTLPLVPLVEARLRLRWEAEGRPTAGLVFHQNGKPVQPKRDWRDWRDLIDQAAIVPFAPLPYIALHAARNSAASLLEAAGVPDRLVMQILGHSAVQITHGYQDAEIGRMAGAFDQVGGLLQLD